MRERELLNVGGRRDWSEKFITGWKISRNMGKGWRIFIEIFRVLGRIRGCKKS